MGDCICSGCKNLKRVIDEDSEEEVYKCEFGYPSDRCEECEEEECDITCSRYEEESDEEDFIVVSCKGCGKELKKAYQDADEGDVFCIDCYLKEEE